MPPLFKIVGPKGHAIINRIGAARLARRLPGLVRRFKRVQVSNAPAPPVDHRALIVAEARWGAAHEPAIHYSETAVRDDWLAHPPRTLPITTDCSGFVTACYRWAGAPDPNGFGFHKLGYTGSMLDHADKHGKILTDVSKARPGDPIVIGPGTGDHVVVVTEAGADPLVTSHGAEGGPRIQRLSVDPRMPRRVCVTLP